MNTEELKQEYNRLMDLVEPKIMGLNWESPQTYVSWMAQTYFYVKYSTRLIGLTGAHLPTEFTGLHNSFMDHLLEEKNHDIVMLQNIKALGYSIEDFEASPASSAIYQTQYYWIQHENPIAFYGFLLFLEGISICHGPKILNRVSEAYGKNVNTYWAIHVQADEGHVSGHFKALEKMKDIDHKPILTNMKNTSHFYHKMLEEVQYLGENLKRTA